MNLSNFFNLLPRTSVVKSLYYSIKFKGIIVVGRRCRINISRGGRIVFNNSKSSLYLGVHFSAYSGTTLDIYENGVLKIGKSVGIYRGAKVVIQKNAKLSIGNRSFINENSRVHCLKGISIGNDCSIAWNCTIIDSDLHGIYVNDVLTNPNSKITIGDKVWICSNTTVTKGVSIEENCIIGANSLVVKKKLIKNHIYSGNPLKKIKEFDHWGRL